MQQKLDAYNFLANSRILNHYKIKWCLCSCPRFQTLLLRHSFSWRLKRHTSFCISGLIPPLPNTFCGCSLQLSLMLFRFTNIFSLLSTDEKKKNLHSRACTRFIKKRMLRNKKIIVLVIKNPDNTFRNISFLVFINHLQHWSGLRMKPVSGHTELCLAIFFPVIYSNLHIIYLFI